jgi:hypothetical protein
MFTPQPPRNKNYCGSIAALQCFRDLPNCDNVKAALIFGNSVIVSKTAQAGDIGVFFPVEAALSREFLGQNNLYRKPEWGNVDPEKKGYFEEHGRIKAVKFRGHKSEGFWIPIAALAYTGIPADEFTPGMEFDKIGDREICRKYVAKVNTIGVRLHQGRMPRVEDKIVEGQFRFHIDTENLRKNVHKIQPTDWISISDKWHGTSAVFANILVKRELNWFERLLQRIGVKVQDTEYGFTWSSRRVVKGVNGESKKDARHFYDTDIWGVVAKEIKSVIPKGYTLYGEIVGYTPEGGEIQKGYTYGCNKPRYVEILEPGSHKFLVYRITFTNPDGQVLELGWLQMKEFCQKYGLEMVKELYFGTAERFLSRHIDVEQDDSLNDWQYALLKVLEHVYVNDSMCPHNDRKVPAEGIVVKVERLNEAESYKLKNFKFLEWETKQLDAGVADIETEEAEEVSV